MLVELDIKDFAIIDQLQLQFAPGFNVLTGETGAGKSIILDAVTLVLGGRADSSVVRADCEQANVEALFTLAPSEQRLLAPLLAAEGLEAADGDSGHIELGREVRLNGRNICRVNGRSVNLSLLRQVGERLIDIHGQGEHLSLLRPKSHLPLLDSYGDVAAERTAVADQVAQLRQVRHALAQLRQDARTMAQRADMLRFQIEEITVANLVENEETSLREERARLANAEQLMRAASEAVTHLNGADDDGASASDLLGMAERSLLTLVRLDESQRGLASRIQGLASELSELTAEVADYQTQLEFNPERLDEVEERLELIAALKRKYGDSVADILELQRTAQSELDQISHSEERQEALEEQEAALLRTIGRLASQLSEQRKAAAERLATAVEGELAELQMNGARFAVDFKHESADDGAFVGEARLRFDQSGIDQVEFLISTNPGEPLKPMARVASGGETARLMLALKTALAQVDATPTLIFDEIDQGIGGRIGNVVGQKLWRLTSVAQHQVIVVTHLPQLAGYGDSHLRVSKRTAAGRTTTRVETLSRSERIDEMAAMLGTSEEHAVGGAEAILRQAMLLKKQAAPTPAPH